MLLRNHLTLLDRQRFFHPAPKPERAGFEIKIGQHLLIRLLHNKGADHAAQGPDGEDKHKQDQFVIVRCNFEDPKYFHVRIDDPLKHRRKHSE